MDFYNAMRMVFPKDSPYTAVTNDICEMNLSYENHYEDFVSKIQDINQMMGDWLNGFEKAKVQLI